MEGMSAFTRQPLMWNYSEWEAAARRVGNCIRHEERSDAQQSRNSFPAGIASTQGLQSPLKVAGKKQLSM